jgi:hypothetical protein
MNWTGKIKPVYVEMPEDLHRAMKSAAPTRGMTLRVAVMQALDSWLAPPAMGEGDPLKRPEGVAPATDLSHADTAGLTAKQIEQVEAFVRLLRLDHPELSAMAEGLLGMSEREYQSREKKNRRNQKAG